jgi:hypothetical protein
MDYQSMAIGLITIWLGVAAWLWVHCKLTLDDAENVEDVPQRSIPGALLWPWFFLISLTNFFITWSSALVNHFKAKLYDEHGADHRSPRSDDET